MKTRTTRSLATFIGVVGTVALTSLATAQASLPLEEHFAYATGNLVGNTINGGTWTQTSGQTASPVQVSAGSLTYGTLPNVSGGKVTLLNGSNYDDPYLDITTSTVGSVYASFILKVVNPGNTSGDYFFALTPGTSSYYSRVYVRQGSSTSNFQLGVGFQATPTSWSGDLPVGTPVFVVVSYDFVAGSGNDTVRLWINPQLGLATPPTADFTASAGTDAAAISRILLRQGSGNTALNLQLDELRVSTVWHDVALPVTLSHFTME
jgi:hypothetical protein